MGQGQGEGEGSSRRAPPHCSRGRKAALISPLYLPYISPISPLYLPYISPISPYQVAELGEAFDELRVRNRTMRS